MTRKTDHENSREQAETAGKPKRYQFEVGRKGLFFYGLCLFMALTWMFVFGILVGRGIPLVSSEEFSLRAHLLRFIGLGPQVAKKAEPEAEEHFDSPRTMLETLDYYLSLTRRQNDGPPPLRTVTNMPVPSAKPPAETAASPHTSPSSGATQPTREPSATTPPHALAATDAGPPEHLAEHFSLLVSSMKEPDNAQRLLDQLRGKGYAPRVETVNLGGSGQWNRVLVGYFASREEAMRFAAEFNRKEKMEALVVRETR